MGLLDIFRKKKTEDPTERLMHAYGALLEKYPGALLGTSRLPAPKNTMKILFKEIWKHFPEMRPVVAQGYIHLANFQDGIDDAVLSLDPPSIPTRTDGTHSAEDVRKPAMELATGSALGMSWRKYMEWNEVCIAEMKILVGEWERFEAEQAKLTCRHSSVQ